MSLSLRTTVYMLYLQVFCAWLQMYSIGEVNASGVNFAGTAKKLTLLNCMLSESKIVNNNQFI